jgi:hypothetical protein
MTLKSIAANDGIRHKKNVISISTGVKSTGGIYTNEPCAVIGVLKKEVLNDLVPDDVIPSILSDGVTKTDVVVVNEVIAHGTCPTSLGNACVDHDVLDNSICGGMQIYIDKLSFDSSLWRMYGTLGAIVRDNDGTLVGLTNNHVVGTTYDTSIGYQWGIDHTVDDTFTHKGANPTCLFPEATGTTYGRMVHYGDPSGDNVILGTTKRTVPIIFNQPSASHATNYSDAALINLNDANFADMYPGPIITDSVSIDKYSNTTPIFDFSKLGDVNDNNICFKVGRTTGKTVETHDISLYSPASGQYASIFSVDSDINVNYISCSGFNANVSENLAWFNNTIGIKYRNSADDWRFSYSGDSGSLCWIWSTDNLRWEVLGLIFAGGCDNDNKNCVSYVCRMDYILKQLQIGEGWTNDPAVGFDTNSIFNFVGSNYTTILSDVSACTSIWNGDINVDAGFISDPVIAVRYNSQQPSICYEKVTGSNLSPTHKSTNFLYKSTTSGECVKMYVELVALSAAVTTVDSTSPAQSTVFAINEVSVAELHLKRNTLYEFHLDANTLAGASHPFQIVDNYFTPTNTWSPSSTNIFYFSAGSTASGFATAGYMNYTCANHGPNMGNFIYFN